jgi:3D (Asp-Asp-Asp) domain-containing protein
LIGVFSTGVLFAALLAVPTVLPSTPVTIEVAHARTTVTTSADNVGALLSEQHISLGPNDIVSPTVDQPVPINGTVHVTRVLIWEKHENRAIAPRTIHRYTFALKPGTTKVLAKGSLGEREVDVRFEQRDDRDIEATVLASHLVRKPHNRVVAQGISEYDALQRFAAYGVARSSLIARSAMTMVATAYTASCDGCGGMTAIGERAGHGIVAVDPSVIPLGTRLFIPGYGLAVAGDTGGSIRGNRIDLGFDSWRDAMLFGRRDVTVYRLK